MRKVFLLLLFLTCHGLRAEDLAPIYRGARAQAMGNAFTAVADDEEAIRSQGKQFMIWGVVSLAVMISVWGLVHVLSDTFGISFGSGVLPQTKECETGNGQGGGGPQDGGGNCSH